MTKKIQTLALKTPKTAIIEGIIAKNIRKNPEKIKPENHRKVAKYSHKKMAKISFKLHEKWPGKS